MKKLSDFEQILPNHDKYHINSLDDEIYSNTTSKQNQDLQFYSNVTFKHDLLYTPEKILIIDELEKIKAIAQRKSPEKDLYPAIKSIYEKLELKWEI